jgi:hypothetical protein
MLGLFSLILDNLLQPQAGPPVLVACPMLTMDLARQPIAVRPRPLALTMASGPDALVARCAPLNLTVKAC